VPTASNPSASARATTRESSSRHPSRTGQITQVMSARSSIIRRCCLALATSHINHLSPLPRLKKVLSLPFIPSSQVSTPVWAGYPLLNKFLVEPPTTILKTRAIHSHYRHRVISNRSIRRIFQLPEAHTSLSLHQFMRVLPHTSCARRMPPTTRLTITTNPRCHISEFHTTARLTRSLSTPSRYHNTPCINTNIPPAMPVNTTRFIRTRVYHHEEITIPRTQSRVLYCSATTATRRSLLTRCSPAQRK
jgi:hypothetical protein